MMYRDPKIYLWLQAQDREREFAQRALDRAAHEGGEQRPGLVRGGISSFASLLRKAGSSVTQIRVGGPRSTSTLSGQSGI